MPTASDDVYINGSSGTGTITLSTFSDAVCKSLNFSGYGGTFTAGSSYNGVYMNGNLTLSASMTISGYIIWNFGINGTLTTNGKSMTGSIVGASTSVVLSLADDLTSSGPIGSDSAISLTTNNHNITTSGLRAVSGTTFTLGSSTITITTSTGWNCDAAATLSAGTSTIKFTDATVTNKTFAGGGKTYNNVWFSGAGTGTFIITGANTFNDLKVDTPPHTIRFPNETTTVTTLTISGTAGNLMTLQRTGASGNWTLSKSSGTIDNNYLSISNGIATGGATFYAGANSTNGGGNTGWMFGNKNSVINVIST